MNRRVVLALAPIVVLPVACGDDDDGATATSAEELCSEVSELESVVEEIASAEVDVDSLTVGDVENALDEVESQVEDIVDAEGDLSDAVRSALEDAHDGYEETIDDIPGDATLAEAGERVATARTQFNEAWADTMSQLDCGEAAPTT